MTEETGTDGAPITTEDYGRILRRAAQGPFDAKDAAETALIRELLDAGMVKGSPGSPSVYGPAVAKVYSITMKGREWMEAPRRDEKQRDRERSIRIESNVVSAIVGAAVALLGAWAQAYFPRLFGWADEPLPRRHSRCENEKPDYVPDDEEKGGFKSLPHGVEVGRHVSTASHGLSSAASVPDVHAEPKQSLERDGQDRGEGCRADHEAPSVLLIGNGEVVGIGEESKFHDKARPVKEEGEEVQP